MGLLNRLANMFKLRRLNQDFEDELEFHRQMLLRKASAHELSAPEA